MGTDEFVAGSALRWAVDDGFDEEVVAGGEIDQTLLGTGGYQHDGYTTDQLTRPGSDPGRVPDLPSGEGFFLDLDDGLRDGDPPQGGHVTTPLTYSYVPGDHITYWFMYGWNPGAPTTGEYIDRHEAEWERVTILLDAADQAWAMDYWAHECDHPVRIPWGELTDADTTYGEIVGGTHPVVYAALGSHASFPDERYVPVDGVCGFTGANEGLNDTGAGQGFGDWTQAGGTTWDTWTVELRDAVTSDWYGFGGAWGEPGHIGDCLPNDEDCVNVTGPLAPPHKQPAEGVPAPMVYGPAPKDGMRIDWGQPNEFAVDRFIWAPGIDNGFTPQGITTVTRQGVQRLVVSGYIEGRGCRAYRINPATGTAAENVYRLPRCSHAGGIAYAGGDRVYLIDTNRVYQLSYRKMFSPSNSDRAHAIVKSWPLLFIDGSFGTYQPHDGRCRDTRGCLWIGTWDPDSTSKIRRIRITDLDHLTSGLPITAAIVPNPGTRTIPRGAQGAAFDPAGTLWVTASRASHPLNGGPAGCVTEQGPWPTSNYLDFHEVAPGTEGISFNPDGTYWTVSEAGTEQYDNYPFGLPGNTTQDDYPLITHVNPTQLTTTACTL